MNSSLLDNNLHYFFKIIYQNYRKIFLYIIPLCILICTSCSQRATEKELISEAVEYMEQGLYVEAIGQLNQALKLRKSGKIDASKLDILAYRAEAEFKMEDYVAAENTYLLISDLDEDNAEYIDMAVASICRGSKDLDEAKELYEVTRAARKDSNAHKFARDELVKLIRAQGGDMDEALSYYREYMEDETKADAYIWYKIGALYMEYEEYETALQYFDKAIATAREGEAEVKKALKFNRAVALEYMGNYSEAIEEFESYMEMYGVDDKATHEIDFLKTRIR